MLPTTSARLRGRAHRPWLLVVGLVTALAAAGCAAAADGPQPRTPDAATTVIDRGDPAAAAIATSAALFDASPVAVLAGRADGAAQARARQAAVRLKAPLLLAPTPPGPEGLESELDRLGADTVLAVGGGAARQARGLDREVVSRQAELSGPDSPPQSAVTALVSDPDSAPAATARAAGARVIPVRDADPRGEPELLGQPVPETVLAVGPEFGSPGDVAHKLEVAATGVELPGGGQVLFPNRRMVALYGHPGTDALGVLGEQPVGAAVERAQQLAGRYAALVDEPVVPTFELITTIADKVPGEDGNYSAESDPAMIRPWVRAAGQAGMYVLLDLQPGRADFLSQAKRYTELLKQPHVGLALDPEWRLEPDQRPLEQIGSVRTSEINRVTNWLADLTRRNDLPQKLLMLHQFKLRMIQNRERLDTSRDEVGIVIHADGFGSPGAKFATWQRMRRDAPSGIWWGWKNFYDEDSPTFTPRRTMSIEPKPPVVVSYQ